MSGQRDDSLLFDDMIQACARLVELGRLLRDGFEPSTEVAEGIQWNLTLLGEASKRTTDQVRSRFPEIEWSSLARTRDRIVHHYEGIDWFAVSDAIATDTSPLLEKLIRARDELRS